MNESQYINPKSCRTCGRCCETFGILYPKTGDDYPVLFSEIERFKALAGIDISVVESPEHVILKFNYPCTHLEQRKGIYACLIYDSPDRPLLCKQYPFEESEDCPYKIEKKGIENIK